MAAPSAVGTGTLDDFTQASGSTLIAYPSGLVVGNRLFWFVLNGTTGAAQGINTPANWVSIDSAAQSGTARGMNTALFTRVIDGSESGNATATGGTGGTGAGMASEMIQYTPCIIGAHSSSQGDHTGTTITATGITIGSAGGTLLAILNAWETDRGPLSGMTSRLTSGGSGLTINDQSPVTAGATGNKTCSCSSTESWQVILAELISTVSDPAMPPVARRAMRTLLTQ